MDTNSQKETFEITLSVVLSLTILAIVFSWNYFRRKLSFKYWYIHFHLFPRRISDSQKHYLTQYFGFYRRLNDKYKSSFDHRVSVFLSRYKIIGRKGFAVNEKEATLIAGCYVQLTFGMEDYISSNFSKILVYPSAYYSKVNEAYHIGEFNPQFRLIVFSWEDFIKGIEIDNNNINLT